MVTARIQTLVQLSDELLELLDGEAAKRGISRSALIREAIEEHLHDAREAEIDQQIVAAYTRMPQTEEEVRLAERAAIETLRRLAEEEDEPW